MTANIQQAPHFIYLFIYIVAMLLQENMYGERVYRQNTTEYMWYNLLSKAQLHVSAAICWPSSGCT
jgi:hypothetical protein